jgi:hypothetical protein
MGLGTKNGTTEYTDAPNAIAYGGQDITYTGRKQAEKAFGSPFTYGSFSGADIKVVLNYPINKRTAGIEVARLNFRKEEIQYEINDLRAQRWDDPKSRYYNNSAAVIQAVASRQEALASIQARIDYLEEWAEKAGQVSATKVLAELQTVSWSIFREKSPVRTLGAVYPRSFVRGPRTIAGTMVFTLFDKSALHDILTLGLNPYNTGTENDRDYYQNTTALIDQLPPLDITIIASNEYGQTSYMNLWGLEFMNDGGTFSIEDLFTETVVQYSARDIDLLRPTISRQTDVLQNVITGKAARKTSRMILEANLAGLVVGTTIERRNPYI